MTTIPARVKATMKRWVNLPIARRLQTSLRELYDRVLKEDRERPASSLTPDAACELRQAHCSRTANHSSTLWAILTISERLEEISNAWPAIPVETAQRTRHRMCGILGLVVKPHEGFSKAWVKSTLNRLFTLSETRGSEAAGLAIHDGTSIHVFRRPVRATSMIRRADFTTFLEDSLEGWLANSSSGRSLAIVGHSRLVTNGREIDNRNNQPVVFDGIVGVHNGVIVNTEGLWSSSVNQRAITELDSEAVFAALAGHASGESIEFAAQRTFSEIEGTASIAALFADRGTLLLATNTGSIYYSGDPARFLLFASERNIVDKVMSSAVCDSRGLRVTEHVPSVSGVSVVLKDLSSTKFPLQGKLPSFSGGGIHEPLPIVDHLSTPASLRRCSKCILPETFPFIDFDEEGVCSYCRNHVPQSPIGSDALKTLVEKHRSNDGSPDSIVMLSGGRDSCYGLHYIKRELELNPVAFTYDWGLVTDLARRNQARMCGRLGVEHIIRSPNIRAKRRNIRKNIEAWLARPMLGMIPIFTAGDKQFYYYARKLRRETGIGLVFFCAGNSFEETRFKTGFAGVRESQHLATMTRISTVNKLQLLGYYASAYVMNPRYFNRSLLDTSWAFFETYGMRDDFTYLFHYIPWDEDEVVDTLKEEYDWETADDTATTWRIGDGTASFYNYIYYTIAGFTEHDTFRSNQIREGVITREKAMERIAYENEPRFDAMEEYSNLVGFNLSEAIEILNAAPRLY